MLLGEDGRRLGPGLRRFLEGQGCVSAAKQEEETCGRKNSMHKGVEERAAAGRARSWKELDVEVAGGYSGSRGCTPLPVELPSST